MRGRGSHRVISWAPRVQCAPPVSTSKSYWVQGTADFPVPRSLRIIPNIDKASLANTRKVKNANSDDPSVLQNQKEMVKRKAGYHLDAGCPWYEHLAFNVIVSLLSIRVQQLLACLKNTLKWRVMGNQNIKRKPLT